MRDPYLSYGWPRGGVTTLICTLSLLCACSTTPGTSGSAQTPLGSNRSEAAHNSPRLFVFDCGAIQFDDVASFGLTNDETSVRELSVPCYLIDHPAGRLLWDAGLPAAMAGNVEPIPLQQGATATYARALVDQLADLNLTPADIDKVAFSHMHFDHIGSANLFHASQLLIQQSEFTAAFEQAEKFEGIFDPSLYGELVNVRRRVLNGDHDVFGDGTVQIISAPGHTPGHQVLLLRLANTGPLILSGDLYHFRYSRSHRRTPTFNYDAAATLATMDKVEALVKAENATFWIQHDKVLFEQLRHAPAYYD